MTARIKHILSRILTVLIIFLILIGTFLLMTRPYFYGFNNIRVELGKVYIRCTAFSVCSIEKVDANATAFRGEGELPINNDLGKYIVKVRFGDAEVAEGFSNIYSSWTTYRIGISRFSFMWSYNAAHGFEIFIGSDMPIQKSDIVVVGMKTSLLVV